MLAQGVENLLGSAPSRIMLPRTLHACSLTKTTRQPCRVAFTDGHSEAQRGQVPAHSGLRVAITPKRPTWDLLAEASGEKIPRHVERRDS